MKALRRPAAPTCFATDTEERTQIHRERYANLRYPSGAFRALWNDLDKDETCVGAARRALLALSDDEWAYCGLLVGNDHMQVDHVLPKEEFRSSPMRGKTSCRAATPATAGSPISCRPA